MLLLIATLVLPISPQQVYAQSEAVSPTGGGTVVGDGTPASCDNNTMRNAIEAGGTVAFNCGPAPISIASDTMQIQEGITTVVDGGGLVTIDGEDLRQPFIVYAGGSLTLTNLVLTNGGWSGDGAAIANYGTLVLDGVSLTSSTTDANGTIMQYSGSTTILRSTMHSNRARQGGAVYMQDGLLDIRESTFTANSASSGGALYIAAGTLMVQNSTFDGNGANAVGGAIYSGVPAGEGALTLVHVTLSENIDDAGQNAIHVEPESPEPVQIQNSILYATPDANGTLCRAPEGGIQSDGYNIDTSDTCPFGAVGDQITTMGLPALADNGGPTQTRLPGAGSAARDKIPADACPLATDQRGTLRPQLATCDVGAVEAVPTEMTPEELTRVLPINANITVQPFYLDKLVIRPFPWPIFALAPNIEAQRLEVTQGIQEADGSGVTLVAKKRTYVRFHVRKTFGATDPVVGARLWRVVNGVRTGDPLLPSSNFALVNFIPFRLGGQFFINDPSLKVVSNPDRNSLGDSFYFKLPASWTNAGSLTIEAEVNPTFLTNSVLESTRADNIVRTTVSFHNTPAMVLRLFNVRYKVNNVVYQASETEMKEAEDWIRRAYPIHSLIVKRDVEDMTNLNRLPTCDDVNGRLFWDNLFLKWAGIDPVPTRLYGLVTNGGSSTRFMRGCAADIPSFIASGPTGDASSVSIGAWDVGNDGQTFGDWYMGHELGHTWGRKHVNCAGTEVGTDSSFPMQNGTIGRRNNSDQYWGFDVALKGPVVYPPTWTEIMSYCSDQWISAYTYEAIRDKLVAENSVVTGAEALGAAVDSLVIQGIVGVGGHSATIEEVYRLNAPQVVAPTEPTFYTIRLLDGSNNLLAEHPFSPRYNTDDPEGEESPGIIMEQVPWPNGLRRIEIRLAGALLDARTVSPTAPTVTVTAPSGDLTVGAAGLAVSWTANDADGDALVATVLYSRDNGVTWSPLRLHLSESTVTIPLAELAGTIQGKVRVIVSDGANTAQDDSEGTITIPNQNPVAQIVTPAEDTTMTLGPLLELSGVATDAETQELDEAAFVWSSDILGTLGSGREVDVMMTEPGVHLITLTVTDPDGGSATATRTVTVTNDAQVTAAAVFASPSSTAASAIFGDATVQTQPLAIRNPNVGSVAWSASSDAPWLTLSAASGNTPGDITLRINPANLGVGIHQGTVTVTSAGLPPQVVNVFLTIEGTQVLLPLVNN